jgi:probable HAF family extracellular repeat protein
VSTRIEPRCSRRLLGCAAVLALGAGVAPVPALAQPTITNLGSLMGTSNAAGVSGDGSVVVGTSDYVPFPGGSRPFRWTSGGGMTNLGTLGGIYGGASGVSGDGLVVVGASETAFR